MKINSMRSHVIKTGVFAVALLIASVAQGFSQFKPDDGLYVVVNFVPPECKAKIDGFYRVSKEGKLSVSFLNVQVAVDRDIQIVREDLRTATQRYCHQNFPKRDAFPDFDIIPEADVKKTGDGVIVMGQARKPGVIPMKDRLTVWQAVQAAGGATEFSTTRHVTILRKEKIIDCDFTKGESRNTLLERGDLVNVPRKCSAPETEYSP
jgi:protein involved in polysaccharide export with SLBB domain